ncbi:MAG: M16 family metallopeptidase [Chloroflexota bacterium]|nr:insulinase family protein [Chloroflexota bacterium]
MQDATSARPPVIETRLSNGLTLLVREARGAPIATFWVWYRVGSRNEVPGTTGASHWVEHMLFKGTERFPKGVADKSIAGCGGVRNGMTWLDYTTYYETVPSDHFALAVAIEADRMANARFLEDEVASERGVVISEREGSENQPGYALYEEVTSAAYRLHSYGRPVVGFKHDLRTMTRDDLHGFYRRHYVPGNAVAIAIGDFDAASVQSLVEKEFGAIPAGEARRYEPPEEPPQQGERRVTVRRPGPLPLLSVAYHVPAADHPDTPSIWMLGAVLGAGRSSRLYLALVSAGLASSASAGSSETVDPHLFRLSVTARPDSDRARVEAVALETVEAVARDGIDHSELAKARRQFRAGHVFGTEGITNQARSIGSSAIAGDWRRADTYLDDLELVTAEDVRRACAKYLVERNRTVGWFIPEGESR